MFAPSPTMRMPASLTNMLVAGLVDLSTALASLATRRPVFHSEADFQLALAWEIKELASRETGGSGLDVYLETRPLADRSVHLDLAFERQDPSYYTAIELKYLTRLWTDVVHGQLFNLRNHSAHDFRRYDVVKDIERVEQFIEGRSDANGAVIVLTNEPAYWKPHSVSEANDLAFRIGQDAELGGPREWRTPPAGSGGRSDLSLRYHYRMNWEEYSSEGPQIRQLVVEVPGRQDASS